MKQYKYYLFIISLVASSVLSARSVFDEFADKQDALFRRSLKTLDSPFSFFSPWYGDFDEDESISAITTLEKSQKLLRRVQNYNAQLLNTLRYRKNYKFDEVKKATQEMHQVIKHELKNLEDLYTQVGDELKQLKDTPAPKTTKTLPAKLQMRDLDIQESDKGDKYVITITLPAGFKEEDVNISLHSEKSGDLTQNSIEINATKKQEHSRNNQHVVQQESRYCSRTLPVDIVTESLKKSFKNGIVTLEFDKKSVKKEPVTPVIKEQEEKKAKAEPVFKKKDNKKEHKKKTKKTKDKFKYSGEELFNDELEELTAD
jgi:HSP20 family molecular chaperone IbpA